MIKRVVPWMNRQEWDDTFKNIYSKKKNNIKKGLDQISVWKSRCPAGLPVAIEVTNLLLKAKLLSFKEKKMCDEMQLRMLYSLAVIQFVNLVLEKYQSKITMIPLRILALKVKIPNWIIDLRHEATHKSLPQIYILKKAADFALKYLKENYWTKQSKYSYCSYSSCYSVDHINVINLNEEQTSDDENNIYEDLESNKFIEKFVEQYFNISKKFFYNRNLQLRHLKPIMNNIRQALFRESKNTLEVIFFKINEKLAIYKDDKKNILDTDFQVLWPMISMLNEFNKLNDLILVLLSIQTEDIYLNKALFDLILAIVNISLCKNADRNIFYFKHPCYLNGRQLIQAAMKSPNCYTKNIVSCLFKCCVEPLSEKSELQLMDLIDIVSQESCITSIAEQIFDKPTISEITFGKWALVNDKIKWSHWPIGKCTFPPNSDDQNLILLNLSDLKRNMKRVELDKFCNINSDEFIKIDDDEKNLDFNGAVLMDIDLNAF